ncbi:ABC transporter ATP-binding protein [Paenibacillus puerhi]|uniref:ABC transporter ATP-binding protein n=1 Tax=Paenibacillus puerhi TaxID=2692622 RepID=UPI00135C649E|nr:ABC transporter ATP-binding protein [Paenibacillus puerhi]
MPGQPLLEVKGLSKSFGGIRAVEELHLSVQEGEFVGLIGPNGAGKTTVFNLLSGTIKPTSGEIAVAGRHLTGCGAEEFAARGVSRTFQNIRLFKQLTVFENVLAGMHASSDRHPCRSLAQGRLFRSRERQLQDHAAELLETFGLARHADELSVHLSYGDQRRLEIARALAAFPKLLLLDEPAAGMNPAEGRQLVELLKQVKRTHQLTFVLIEHDMDVVMELCDRIRVLDCGKSLFEGTPEEVRRSPAVREAYLGVEDEHAELGTPYGGV